MSRPTQEHTYSDFDVRELLTNSLSIGIRREEPYQDMDGCSYPGCITVDLMLHGEVISESTLED